MSKNFVVLLNSVFPVLSETFLFSQYSKLIDGRMDMALVSSNRPLPEQVHPGMEAIQRRVDYLCDASLAAVLLAHLAVLIRHPLGYISALLRAPFAQERLLTTVKHISGAALVLQRYSGQPGLWVHSHFTYGSTGIAMWIKRIAGVPYSITLHGSDLTFDNPPDLEAKLNEADRIVCISRYNAEFLAENYPLIEPERMEILPLGVAPLPEHPVPAAVSEDKVFRILSVGRLSTQKAQEYLLRACGLLRDKGHRFRCELVGEGPQRAYLEAEIRRLGLEEQVFLLGARYHEEVLSMYRGADLFVMSSVAEGMPIVLMEAMQAGVPVVSTAISGIPELLDDGRAGVLVPPADETALARAIEDVLLGRIDSTQLRHNAMQHIASSFDQGKNAERFQYWLEQCQPHAGGRVHV